MNESQRRSLREHRDRLLSETKRLNDAIASTEIALREVQLGVGASVRLWPVYDHALGEIGEEHLGFRKLEDKEWRLTLEFHYRDPSQDTEIEPLGNARRHVRVAAASHLDELLASLVSAAAEQAKSVGEAATTFEAFTERLRGGVDAE